MRAPNWLRNTFHSKTPSLSTPSEARKKVTPKQHKKRTKRNKVQRNARKNNWSSTK